MKTGWPRLLILLLALCCLGCTAIEPMPLPVPEASPSASAETVPTEEPRQTMEPLLPGSEPQAEHSPLYIPGLNAEEVITYFNEVCLAAEFVHSGSPEKLQKWQAPIYYKLYGAYTAEDKTILESFVAWLNTVEGFPGMIETQREEEAMLEIYFCLPEELERRMGEAFAGQNLDGAVTFWYENDVIYDAIICCRSDIDQTVRNSVLQEEIYNGLGPVQDTDLREDSLIYSGYSTPQTLTEVDRLVLQLLYHPQMECGMDAQACAEVIRKLYY